MKLVISIMLIAFVGIASAQEEPGLATFQETAQVLVDKSITQNVTVSITLQSTSIQELRIPAELEQKIREEGNVKAIVLTNQNQCILGVYDESCIMINIERETAGQGIVEIQHTAREIGDQYIDSINEFFQTDAKFHSVFIHSNDQSNQALETSGIISGRGAISVVYTMTMEDTDSMYEKSSALLLPKEIRELGGFFDTAKELSTRQNAKMTFSLIPVDTRSLMQLKLSVDYPGKATDLTLIDPLEFLDIDELTRSDYFGVGFYPLNSLIQVIVLSPEETFISSIAGNQLETQTVDGQKIPTDITKQGWVFDPDRGNRIEGIYLFGEDNSVNKQDLRFALDGEQVQANTASSTIDDYIIIIIITIGAAAAAIFYLKGYKKS